MAWVVTFFTMVFWGDKHQKGGEKLDDLDFIRNFAT